MKFCESYVPKEKKKENCVISYSLEWRLSKIWYIGFQILVFQYDHIYTYALNWFMWEIIDLPNYKKEEEKGEEKGGRETRWERKDKKKGKEEREWKKRTSERRSLKGKRGSRGKKEENEAGKDRGGEGKRGKIEVRWDERRHLRKAYFYILAVQSLKTKMI